MEIVPYGDTALLIHFENIISPHVHDQVLAYYYTIKDTAIPAVQSCVPAYSSLLVYYNKQQSTFEELSHLLATLVTSQKHKQPTKTLIVPICYDAPFALDMHLVCQQTGLTVEEIIHTHQQATYRVYMLGFLPGFAYLGTVPSLLHCSRKENPRLQVPKGAVGLAGAQTGIYPSASPGGWQIIGQTPINMFDPNRSKPFLVKAGDAIRFEAISSSTFETIKTAVQHQKWEANYE